MQTSYFVIALMYSATKIGWYRRSGGHILCFKVPTFFPWVHLGGQPKKSKSNIKCLRPLHEKSLHLEICVQSKI